MPRMDDALDSIGISKPKYFSCIDLQSGYFQVGLEKSSQEKTAFITHAGLYHFLKLPQGLS